MQTRRDFVKILLGSAALTALLPRLSWADDAIVPLNLSDDEWRKKLTPAQYDILRQEGTERAFTSNLLNEHRAGTFACVGCGLPLFDAATKFDSGTGWPSFYAALPGHVQTKTDTKLLVERTEYHCARCGGHHGHVFSDGPPPTGLRYCNNGAVLVFTPAAA